MQGLSRRKEIEKKRQEKSAQMKKRQVKWWMK
jgi:hypothetical protein